jgi:hypothetical protein
MKCLKCGEDYPSKHYFKTRRLCQKCYDNLSPEEQNLAEESDDASFANADILCGF